MIEYQNILEELRARSSARQIADKGLASRNKVRSIIEAVAPLGWLEASRPVPTAEEIRTVLAKVLTPTLAGRAWLFVLAFSRCSRPASSW